MTLLSIAGSLLSSGALVHDHCRPVGGLAAPAPLVGAVGGARGGGSSAFAHQRATTVQSMKTRSAQSTTSGRPRGRLASQQPTNLVRTRRVGLVTQKMASVRSRAKLSPAVASEATTTMVASGRRSLLSSNTLAGS
jgi:hypothetical protein